MNKILSSALVSAIAATAIAGDVALPEPGRDAMSLGQALAARRTHREFAADELTDQELSDLLWAANGYNRPDEKKRTAPTAMNRHEVDLYVCRKDGAYLWDAASNVLRQVSAKDLRGLTGRGGPSVNFALKAPIAIIYVIDFDRQGMGNRPEDALRYASVDCGFIGQNIYLHAAASGLRTVFLGSLDPQGLTKELGLTGKRVPLFAQTVGHAPAAVAQE